MLWRPTRFATARGRAKQTTGSLVFAPARSLPLGHLGPQRLQMATYNWGALSNNQPTSLPIKPKSHPLERLLRLFLRIHSISTWQRVACSATAFPLPRSNPAFLTRRHHQHLEDLHASPMQEPFFPAPFPVTSCSNLSSSALVLRGIQGVW